MAEPHLRDVSAPLPQPPYPAETTAGTYCLQLDGPRIMQSDTWKLAVSTAPELCPWLLMMWMQAWMRVPTGTMPNDDELVGAIIGMPLSFFNVHKRLLMRGWVRHSDDLLYHRYLTAQVLRMLRERREWRSRQNRARTTQNIDSNNVTKESLPDVDLTVTKKGTSTVQPVDKSTYKSIVQGMAESFGMKPKNGETEKQFFDRVWEAGKRRPR